MSCIADTVQIATVAHFPFDLLQFSVNFLHSKNCSRKQTNFSFPHHTQTLKHPINGLYKSNP